MFTGIALGCLPGSTTATASHNPQSVKVSSLTGNSRPNVTFTGKFALYRDPQTSGSRQIILTKSQLKRLAKSTNSKDNFVALKVAKEANGKRFYWVRSFDNRYQGWIYGGKQPKRLSGGVKQFITFKESSVPESLITKTFKLATFGLVNDGKNSTYRQPLNTVLGAGRTVNSLISYQDSTFRIDKIGERTREGDTWVHVKNTDAKDTRANGWIELKGLVEAEPKVSDDTVRIDILNSAGHLIKYFDYQKPGAQSGQTLGISYLNDGTPVWLLKATDQKKIQDAVRASLSGTGYTLDAITSSKGGFLAQATFGGKAALTALPTIKIGDDAIRINVMDPNDSVIGYVDFARKEAQRGTKVGSLAAEERKQIQSQLDDKFKASTYQIKLTDSQYQQIANGNFGGQVYVSASSKTNKIADNAVRINLVSGDNKNVVRSFDYVNTDSDNPAKKGSTLGVINNGKLQLLPADRLAIIHRAIAILDGTGYQIGNGEQISDADADRLASAKFGDSINVPVKLQTSRGDIND